MSPVRSCVVCRSRRPRGELLRLSRDPAGQVIPDLSGVLPGRGGWVCPTAECLRGLCARPRQLGRAFRSEAVVWPAAAVLRARLLQAVDSELFSLIRRCGSAGLVRSGARGVREAEGPILSLLFAVDAGAPSRTAAQAAWPDAQASTLTLDRSELGRLIHAGPRAVLAVRAGTPGDQLAHRLRVRQALG